MVYRSNCVNSSFFFNDTATTEIYTLSLHDALPICMRKDINVELNTTRNDITNGFNLTYRGRDPKVTQMVTAELADRKSTRLNSSHANISYAVFCLNKKSQN